MSRAARRLAGLTGTDVPRRARWRLDTPPGYRMITAAAVAAGCLAFAAAGPVAAVIAGWYTVAALLTVRRAVSGRLASTARTAALDVVGGLAADLRAGATPALALAATTAALAGPDPAVARVRTRLAAACAVSERLGAPLADLLDRVEADLRAVERTRATVGAQTTGARASATLLGLLPVAGVGLGYAMGADPGRELLHTPIGAVCALVALVLQGCGQAWTAALCRRAVGRAA